MKNKRTPYHISHTSKESPPEVFITGGAGFIGVNLVQYLLGKGNYRITVYDNLSNGSLKNLNNIIRKSDKNNSVKFIKGDILDTPKLNKAIKGHVAVVHLAAQTSVIESVKNPKHDFDNNALGIFNVLEAVRKNEVKRLIFASSNAAVGEQVVSINEKMLPKPISPYGVDKLYGEALCYAYANCYGIKCVSLRFANVYGPYSDYKESVIARFLRRIKKGQPLEIYGNGKQTRDFVHAGDISQAIYLSLSQNIKNDVFQIASGVETSIIDLVYMIRELVAKSGSNIPEVVFCSKRKGEIRKNFSDINKARNNLGFNPGINLRQGLKELWLKGGAIV